MFNAIKKNKNFILSTLILIGVFVCFNSAFAQLNMGTQLGNAGSGAFGESTPPSLPTLIGNVIGVILGILGMVLVILILYAGFLWMTSGGDDKQAQKGQTYIKNAVAGLAVVIAAYALTNFVIDSLAGAVEGR